MKGAFISSYYPRESGLTTFNQDLLKGISAVDPSIEQIAVAVNEGNSLYDYPPPVLWQIRENVEYDYIKVAEKINESDVDFACLQHEFSQFGGYNGNYILSFIEALKKPLICVSHTVPIRKDAHKPFRRKEFFTKAAPRVSMFVTFLADGKDSLVSYGISPNKVVTIPHGVPDIPAYTKSDLRRSLRIDENIFMLFSFGWIHPNKGTLYSVEAMNFIKKKKIPAKLFISGNIINNTTSKKYLSLIKQTIKDDSLESFIDLNIDYIPDSEIYDFINACDVGLVPYTYKSYTSSGPLSFFIGGKKPIIATRFAYADFILPGDAYLSVPFKDSKSIADAVEKLYVDPTLRASLVNNLIPLRRNLMWNTIAKEYIEAFKKAVG